MNTFAENLSIMRKRAGLTQDELADMINVSIDTIRRWEGAKQEPRLNELKLVAKVLGTNINVLAGEDTEPILETTQDKNVKTRTHKNPKRGFIVIQQGNIRVEIPATSQGYAVLKDNLKDVLNNQDTSAVSLEV